MNATQIRHREKVLRDRRQAQRDIRVGLADWHEHVAMLLWKQREEAAFRDFDDGVDYSCGGDELPSDEDMMREILPLNLDGVICAGIVEDNEDYDWAAPALRVF